MSMVKALIDVKSGSGLEVSRERKHSAMPGWSNLMDRYGVTWAEQIHLGIALTITTDWQDWMATSPGPRERKQAHGQLPTEMTEVVKKEDNKEKGRRQA